MSGKFIFKVLVIYDQSGKIQIYIMEIVTDIMHDARETVR